MHHSDRMPVLLKQHGINMKIYDQAVDQGLEPFSIFQQCKDVLCSDPRIRLPVHRVVLAELEAPHCLVQLLQSQECVPPSDQVAATTFTKVLEHMVVELLQVRGVPKVAGIIATKKLWWNVGLS